MPSPTMCLVFCFSLFFASFFFLFSSISIDDIGATSGVFLGLPVFCLLSNGFLLCDHGLDLEIGLCENSINRTKDYSYLCIKVSGD